MSNDIQHKQTKLFNTPIEIGLRSLIILNANCNTMLDIERLMYLDYLCLNTSDIGGPESLHAPIPNRGVQVYSKKDLIQQGLSLLLSKELINLIQSHEGFMYSINEAGIKFLSFFQTKYYNDLVERSLWVNSEYGEFTSQQIKEYIDSNIQNWGSEFLDENEKDI